MRNPIAELGIRLLIAAMFVFFAVAKALSPHLDVYFVGPAAYYGFAVLEFALAAGLAAGWKRRQLTWLAAGFFLVSILVTAISTRYCG